MIDAYFYIQSPWIRVIVPLRDAIWPCRLGVLPFGYRIHPFPPESHLNLRPLELAVCDCHYSYQSKRWRRLYIEQSGSTMEAQDPQRETQTLKPSQESQQHVVHTPTLLALLDLLDIRHLILEAFLHPIEAVKAYTPQLSMGLFGSKAFDPATDIPDLTGKVVLVTGGKPVFPLSKSVIDPWLQEILVSD